MWVLLHPACNPHDSLFDPTPPNLETFEIQATAGGQFKGYLIAGTNGATVIFPPAYGNNRAGRWNEAKVLWDNGYTVVLFESRRCAGMGALSLGYQEVNEVADVLEYLRRRDDIDMARIGIHGFSSGGATAIMAAARYPELRAVVAEGGYANMQNLIDKNSVDAPLLFRLWAWSMQITYQSATGNSVGDLDPLGQIEKIAPRPILLIYGSNEPSLADAYRQYDAANGNAELWVVEGATHGGYVYVAPDAYEARVTAFFERVLLN